MGWQTGQTDSTTASYRGHRFPPEIISHAVWLHHRFCLSFRDIEDLLAEREIALSYESIRRRNTRPSVVHDTSRYANGRAEVSHQLRPAALGARGR